MDESKILENFGGTPLDMDRLSSYEQWAYQFFHKKEFVADPLIELTLQLDLSRIDETYRRDFASTPGSSLTAYLTWSMIQAIKKNPSLMCREVGGKWYRFDNLPIFFPVATNNEERFHEVFMENAFTFDWSEFCSVYRESIDKARDPKERYAQISATLFHLAFLIANMPQIQFSAVSMHKAAVNTGRSCFYFGKRYQADGKLMIPLYVSFDHSNADPVIISALMEDFDKIAS